MKVASPNPSNKKSSSPPPGKPKKSSNQKAADLLKKALQDGKLNDVLWKEETEVSRLVQKRRATSLAEKRSTATSFDIEREMTLNDAMMLDDVAIWNRLLQARVLHTMKNLGPHWNEQFKEGDYNNREDDSDDSEEDSDYDSDSDSDSSDDDSDEDDDDDDYEDEDDDEDDDVDDDDDEDETEEEEGSSMRGSSDKTEGISPNQSAKQRKQRKKKMMKRKRRKRRMMKKANQELEGTKTDAPEETTSDQAQAPPRTSSDETQSTATMSKKSKREKKKEKKRKQKKNRTRFSIEVLEIGDIQKKLERKKRRRERRKNKKQQSEMALMEGLAPASLAEAHVLSLEEQLKALDTLTVRDRVSEGYSKKTWRVADMIKSSRISQIRPFSSSPTPSEPKSETNKQESPTYNDSSDEEDRASSNQTPSEVKWGGTVARLNKHAAMVDLSAVRNRKNSHQVSLDVVAGLFQMSNELRQERESIMSRGANNREGTPNDIDDFLHRKTTLKYSEQLDEVAMTKQEAFLTQKRAAVLRLKKTAIQYKVPQPPNITRFTNFWSIMQDENDRRGGGNFYLELNRLPSAHTDSDQEESDFSSVENVVMEEKSNKLETVLEENLGLLFQTKARAAMTAVQRFPSRPSSVASFRSDESNGILLRQRSQIRPPKSKLQSLSKEDGEMNDSDIDTHSVKSISAVPRVKTPSLAAAINRLRHLGVLAEGKLRHTYGLTKKRSEDWKKEEESRKIEAEKRKKELEEQQERLRRAQFLRDQQQYITGKGSPDLRNVSLEFDGPNAELQSNHELLRTESRFASQVSNASNTVTNIQLTMDFDNSRPRANVQQSSSFDPYDAFLSNPAPVKQYEAAGKIIHQRIMLSALMSRSDKPELPNPIPSVSPPAPEAKKKAKKKEKTDEDDADDNVFLTQLVSHVEIGNQDDFDQGYLNPNSLHGPSYQIVDAHRILPRPYEPSTSRGKWGYDPSLSVQPAKRLHRREDEERINEIERKRRRWYQEDYVHNISRNEYPLAKPKEVHKEILFDQREKTLLLVTYEEDQPKDCSEVPITSVFLTDSVFPDMLMLRTYDTFNVPSGYLGTFFLDQWAKIEREINASLLEEYVLSLTESTKDIGPQGSSISSAIIIPRFGLLQGGMGLDGVVGKASIPLYAIRPPLPLPVVKKEAILQAKEASIMKRKGRFDRLLPSQAAIENSSSIHTQTTKVSSFIQAEEPVSVVNKQKKSVRIATETSLVSSQASNIQQMPANLPPTKQKVNRARERGYEASGFAALSQNVSITILGKSVPSAQSSLVTYSVASVPSTAMNPMAPIPPPPPSLKKAQSVDELAIEAARAAKRIPSRPVAPPQTKKTVRSVRLVEEPVIYPAVEFSSSSSASLPPFDDSRTTTAGEPVISEKSFVEDISEEHIFTNASELSDYSDRTSSTAFSFLNTMEDYEAFTYECQVILLIESRRLMQLYFTKKFLQLDLAVNVEMTVYDAAESLAASPEVYGLILASYQDLNYNGDIRRALEMLLPPGMDRGAFSVYVYDLNVDEGQELEILETLEACGVEDVFSPPYTLEVLKDALNVHKRKQDLLMKYSPLKATTKRNKSTPIDVLGPNVYVKGGFA